MLLGDADIEGPVGKCATENVESRAVGMAAVIATILSSFSASSTRLSANTRVYNGALAFGFGLRAGDDVELR